MRRQIKIYLTVFVLIIGASVLLTFIGTGNTYGALAIAVPLMGFYGVWAWSLCRRLQPSNAGQPWHRAILPYAAVVLAVLAPVMFGAGRWGWALAALFGLCFALLGKAFVLGKH